MLWRYHVIGTRSTDKFPIELIRTFSHERAMATLALYHKHYRSVYDTVVVEFPWWSFITTN